MDIKILLTTMRSATLEISDGGIYETKALYDIYVNHEKKITTNKVVTSLFGLKPDTNYTVEICEADRETDGVITKPIIYSLQFHTEPEFVTLNVKAFGAKGDGIQDDTSYIQAAIMACPEQGRVLVPRGIYKIHNLFLKSNLYLELEKDAELLADQDRFAYPIMPGMIESYDEQSEYNLGTWEGNPLPMFAGILTGLNVENVVLYGEGSINGNATKENWWHDVRTMVGAFRPRMLFLSHCKNVAIQGLCFHDSPSWTLHPYFSENLKFYNLYINNPADSPNTDGLDPESCTHVDIAGVHFSLGDDCIAVKSGKIYMGKSYHTPSSDLHIHHCLMENGHGAVTIGSEMAGGVKDLVVENCIFRHTDRGLRIKTRRGRGKDAVIDGICFEHIDMDHVMTPLVINCFYFCDPDGHADYVQSRKWHQVDERTPEIKKLVFRDLTCHNCHVAAGYFEGLPEQKIEEIVLEHVEIDFAKEPKSGVPAMSEGVPESVKRGLYASNIKKLVLQDIQITGQNGKVTEVSGIDDLSGTVQEGEHNV
ncbi:MAG: glycoside hydrolase family 28 protein [Lachnospiraceae bacterium]|nr:glycoside hydrolase family 28 protein [Lachnospiraceae bacterium]